MYIKISQRLANKLIKFGVIKDSDYEVYKYGFELLASLTFTTIIILFISIVVDKVVETILFLPGFLGVRAICGGYHTKHHYSCFLSTISLYILFLLIHFFIHSKPYLNLVAFFLTIISSVIIIAFAPVEHTNNPMTAYRKSKNRFLSVVFAIIIFLIHFVALFFESALLHIFSFTLGVVFAAFTILAAKIEIIIFKRKEKQP